LTHAAPLPLPPFPFADRIRGVLFDAGNTLLWIDHGAIAEILVAAGVSCDTGSVRDAEMRARPFIDGLLARAEKREGREVVRRSVEALLGHLGASPPADVAERIHGDLLRAWPRLWIRPPADALPALLSLAARGLPCGVVSNSDGRVERLFEETGLRPHLACVVDSGREGIEKPDPRLFLRGAAALGLPADACVYLGDLRTIDALGARNAGLHGVLLDPIGAWPPCDVPKVRSLTEFAARLTK
jgi:HAD superfamily hydrolase (TIGR01509 family)